MPHASPGSVRRAGLGVAAAALAVAALLRAPITGVPPILSELAADLHFSATVAGVTTSLPLVCFGVFAFAAPLLVARIGLERALLLLLMPLSVGLLLRSAGGAAAFFVGTVLVGCGIALGNVLVPPFIRARFADRVAVLMGAYTVMLQLSGAVGPLVSVALHGPPLGWAWPAVLVVWVVPALGTALWWGVLVRRTPAHDPASASRPTGLAEVATRPVVLLVTAFMGLQSAIFYGLITWLPAQLTDQGLSTATTGVVLSLFSLLGIPGAFLAPSVATSRYARPWVVAVCGVQVVALLSLDLGPAVAVVAALVCGLAQGAAFSTALTYVADHPRPGDVPAISALAQGVGYLVAAVGPVLLGALYEATGSWWVPDLVLVGVLLTLIGLGCVVGPRLHAARGRAQEASSAAA